MDKQDIDKILQIVKDAFENNLYTDSGDTILGIESSIEGVDDFYKEIETKLNEKI